MRAHLLAVHSVGLSMHLVADQGQGCPQPTVRALFFFSPSGLEHFPSYVQELEARLLHMESLFQQIAPTLQNMGQPINGLGPLPATNPVTAAEAVSPTTSNTPPQPTVNVEPDSSTVDDDFSESFGQLALDEYGHMRWIGGSSTMSLIQSFKALTTSPLHRISPMEEDPQAPGPSVNKLYFPAAIFFGKVDALPGPEEVEYPERDLADRLVSTLPC